MWSVRDCLPACLPACNPHVFCIVFSFPSDLPRRIVPTLVFLTWGLFSYLGRGWVDEAKKDWDGLLPPFCLSLGNWRSVSFTITSNLPHLATDSVWDLLVIALLVIARGVSV